MPLNYVSLGQIQPNTADWQVFNTAFPEIELFRISFLNLPANTSSWIVLKPHHVLDSIGFQQGKRFYPSPDPQIFEFPIPQVLKDQGFTLRDFYIRKFFRYRLGRYPDGPYTVKLEELY